MAEDLSPNLRFDWQPATRLVCGVGASDLVGEWVAELGLRRVLLVTDAGLVAAGHPDRVRRSLEARGVAVHVYDRVQPNPTGSDVEHCRSAAAAAGVDGFVGLGGGSSLDTAKGANFVLTNGGSIEDYWGVGKAKAPLLPLVAVPTTAGTGSEMQSFALVSRDRDHRKMACGDRKALPRLAVLDASLTRSLPRGVAAVTGVDALTHALETAVTRRRNPISELFSAEAFVRLAANLERALEQPQDDAARESMLVGAAFAGHAIEHSMLGAAHALANPLTAHFDVVHGAAVGLLLPHVVRFNARDASVRTRYAALARRADLCAGSASDESALVALLAFLERVLEAAGLPRTLGALQVPRDRFPGLAQDAAEQWTAQFNPVPVTATELLELYESAR